MADAAWTEVHDKGNVRCWSATINSTDVDTAALTDADGLNLNAKRTYITINVAASETAIQVQGSVKHAGVEADVQPLVGATAISADFDKVIDGGIAVLQVTGATQAGNTTIVVTQVL